jgi:drug/metabolite transporter (DMT)-like permease
MNTKISNLHYLKYKRPFTAYTNLIISMILLGSTYVFAKILLLDFPVLLLLFFRFLIGTVLFGLLYFANTTFIYQKNSLKETFSENWFLLVLQAFFGAFLFNLFMLYGIKYTTAGTAAIITSALPVFISFFAFLFLKENINKYKTLAILVSVIGIVLVTVDFNHSLISPYSSFGNIFVFLAVVSGAVFPICVKRLTNTTTASNTLISFAFNLFGLIPFALLSLPEIFHFNFSTITINAWTYVFLYSIIFNVLYIFFWNKGLKKVSASTASLFIAFMPISATIFAYLFLHESLNYFQIMGMSLIILSIIIGVYRAH